MAIVEVDGLRKAYGGRTVVDGVSFGVEEGEIFGILGPNGAGKTTTVECVEGLRTPDAGTVRVAGLDPVADHEQVTRLYGAQLQESELQPKLTVREALELYASFYERPADWRPLAARLGLVDKLGSRFAKLSGGQKQRLFIALALIGNPRVVVLDELTTGLDPVCAVSRTQKIATAVGSVIFFPSMFTAGVWLPVQTMPDTLQRIVGFTPLGAASQALDRAAAGGWPAWTDLAVTALWTAVLTAVAVRRFRWE